MKHAPSAEVRRYWAQLAAGGCVITGAPPQIAHCHNGSIRERMGEPKAKGVKLARYHWLVLPLAPRIHAELDADVRTWEQTYGPQADWIDLIGLRFGIDLWARAQEGRK